MSRVAILRGIRGGQTMRGDSFTPQARESSSFVAVDAAIAAACQGNRSGVHSTLAENRAPSARDLR
jgi:hypothetical protein